MMKAQLQQSGTQKLSWKLRMPGKVISATGAEFKDQEVAIEFNFSKNIDEAIAAMMKMQTKGLTIVSEPGNVPLADLPLDSAKLQEAMMVAQGDLGEDVPITDAQQPYVVEALAVTTTAVRWYPEGRKFLGEGPEHHYRYGDAQTSGCTVTARIHAPKGASILGLAQTTIDKAVDEKNRAIPSTEGVHSISYGGSSDERTHGDFDLELSLPAPDAEAIEHLEGSVVVTTCTGWKELAIVHEDAGKDQEADISSLIPGGKLVIKKSKHEMKNQPSMTRAQGNFDIVITSDEAGLEFDVRIDGFDDLHAYDSHSSRSGTTLRKQIQYTGFHHGDNAPAFGKPTLIVKIPQQLKREKVKFKLQAMDLF
jgi:hypothetical protein